jgi:ABC-type Fe3+/spermidine/putrescine transport system ATPase subunit
MLTISNLSKSYNGKVVLNNLSFSVDEGKIIGILGESGCGKSTLLRLIAGFEHLDGGDISLFGQSISKLPVHKRGIGMFFQDYALFPHKTVVQNIEYGVQAEKGNVQDLIAICRLKGEENKTINQLSGGQKQRVALARALANQPKLLLLDEPFSNLDTSIKEILREELKNIVQRFGTTTLFVSHDMDDAFFLADEVILLHDNKIQQIGSPYELYSSPKNPFVAQFFGPSWILSENEFLSLVSQKKLSYQQSYQQSDVDCKLLIRPHAIQVLQGLNGFLLVDYVFKGGFFEYSFQHNVENFKVIHNSDLHLQKGESYHLQVNNIYSFDEDNSVNK